MILPSLEGFVAKDVQTARVVAETDISFESPFRRFSPNNAPLLTVSYEPPWFETPLASLAPDKL